MSFLTKVATILLLLQPAFAGRQAWLSEMREVGEWQAGSAGTTIVLYGGSTF